MILIIYHHIYQPLAHHFYTDYYWRDGVLQNNKQNKISRHITDQGCRNCHEWDGYTDRVWSERIVEVVPVMWSVLFWCVELKRALLVILCDHIRNKQQRGGDSSKASQMPLCICVLLVLLCASSRHWQGASEIQWGVIIPVTSVSTAAYPGL